MNYTLPYLFDHLATFPILFKIIFEDTTEKALKNVNQTELQPHNLIIKFPMSRNLYRTLKKKNSY